MGHEPFPHFLKNHLFDVSGGLSDYLHEEEVTTKSKNWKRNVASDTKSKLRDTNVGTN